MYLRLGLVALAWVTMSCASERRPFWESRSSYEITLDQPSDSALPTAESSAISQPVVLVFRLDSLVRDSLRGRYEVKQGNIRDVLVQDNSDPGEAIGIVSGDSIQLTFEPRVRDGSLRLDGVATGGNATGVWEKSSHLHGSGKFRIIPH